MRDTRVRASWFRGPYPTLAQRRMLSLEPPGQPGEPGGGSLTSVFPLGTPFYHQCLCSSGHPVSIPPNKTHLP